MKKTLIALVVAAAAAGGYYYAKQQAYQIASSKVDEQLQQLESQHGVKGQYESLDVNIFNKEVTLRNLSFASQGSTMVNIEKISAQGIEDTMPEHFTFNVKNLALAEPMLAQFPVEHRQVLSEMKFNLDMDGSYKADMQKLQMTTKFAATDVASISFGLDFEGAGPLVAASESANALAKQGQPSLEQQLQVQSDMMASLKTLSPRQVKLSVNNDGRVNELLSMLAQQQGMGLPQLQEMAKQSISSMNYPAAVSEPLLQFVDELKHLTVSMGMPEGFKAEEFMRPDNMRKLQDPQQFIEFVNLKVSTRPL